MGSYGERAPPLEDMAEFEQTETYRIIQRMLTELRETDVRRRS